MKILQDDPNRTLVDIVHSSVAQEGNNYVFTVTMASALPSIGEPGPSKRFDR
jgi:hypothetical protein